MCSNTSVGSEWVDPYCEGQFEENKEELVRPHKYVVSICRNADIFLYIQSILIKPIRTGGCFLLFTAWGQDFWLFDKKLL